MSTLNKRRNLSSTYTSKDQIQKLLQPRTRSFLEIMKRAYIPVLKDKKLVGYHIGNGIAGGLLPVLSAFIIYWLVSILEEMNLEDFKSLDQSRPLILTVGLYSLVFILLSLISIDLERRKFTPFMKIRMGKMNEAIKKLISLEYGFFENSNFMDIVSKSLNAFSGTNSGMEGIYHEVFSVTKNLVAFILLSIILGAINIFIPLIGLVAILITSLSQSAYAKYHTKLMADFSEVDRKLGYLNNKATDFSYGKDIRVFNMKDRFSRLVLRSMKNLSELQRDLRRKKQVTAIPTSLGFSLLSVGIVYVLGKNFQDGSISLANLVMTLSIIVIYIAQILEIGRVIFFVMEQSIYIGIYYDIEDSQTEISGGLDLKVEEINPEIVFKNVYFKYPNSENYVLEDLNLKINPKESIALVGVNGAGKTTLVNLITGLYQPTNGRITIGGYDITSLSQETLNKLIGVVLQDFEPLALKVKDNVGAKVGYIDDELVIKSLKEAGIYDKIKSFEKGIDSVMLRVIEDDGLVLSGGENQKISIARALYKDQAKILILDEPTSALDALAEEEIYRDFESMIKNKTGIFISHRLASTRFCDKILLLNGGKIEQIGTHEELLKVEGMYKNMYKTQSSYYMEDQDEKNI